MRQWTVLYRKELTEMARNYKLLWIPIVFILLGVMQPVSSYYMQEILDTFGGLPEGTILEMPTPTGVEVLMQVLSNYGMFGVLILVLSAMGVVSAERQSGVAGMIMIKPVPYSSYIVSKWAGLVTITLISLFTGYAASWYYTNVLIETVPFELIFQSVVIYSIWLVFVVTLTLFFSTIMKGNGSVAFVTIFVVFALSTVTSILGKNMKWSPATMIEHTGQTLLSGEVDASFLLAFMTTIAMIIVVLISSIQIFKRKELLD
ncbi:ABC transporter permease [Alkalicoccobacillus murimartini]|uniref:ABC-2 type transport system permease protein n=1 Tax=Alkalicoccobacillus murimartini TaxID=171685 RepID=A0ABT9YQL1_9BACI|nr:ABC transporter permease subunit [Alkalicoccobacillus murimartini]MDQ0209309.1 ABC-2 type transport system permease protein [Alkalicoccobacillus murimartini]